MVDEEKCVKAATGSSLQSTVYAVLVHFTSYMASFDCFVI